MEALDDTWENLQKIIKVSSSNGVPSKSAFLHLYYTYNALLPLVLCRNVRWNLQKKLNGKTRMTSLERYLLNMLTLSTHG